MIRLGLDAMAIEMLGNLFGGFLQGDVNDARLAHPLAHPLHQSAALVCTTDGFHQQVEIGPVEARGDHIVRSNGELRLHVGNHLGRRCSRQQQGLWDIELTLVVRQLQIVRTEVMAPFGNTVRLIHHQQRDLHALQEVAKTLVLQALHGNHQDLQLTRTRTRHHIIRVFAALGRIDAACRNAMALQETQLVLHQRQQRRHHQRQVRQQHCRQLITKGFAGARGKNRGSRTAGQHGADRLFLAQTKLWITKDLLEGVVHKLSLH